MSFRNWLLKQMLKKQQIINEYEQERAEKLRKKTKLAKPGTISYGLIHRQNPIDLAKDVIERRKMKRE